MVMCSDHFANYDLSENSLGDDGAMLLAEALKSSLHIVSLNLSSNSLTHKGAHFIFEALLKNQSLVDLNLSSIPVTGKYRNTLLGKGCSPLVKLLQTNKFLTILNLKGIGLSDLGVKYLAEGFHSET
jgi:hypothetical protein